ncbi:thiosulfate sulfurtransferase/rhodanese-like domain-containing protein 2 [Antedon mediterranea]|uniref:thiosulfate sulfurtransferase/rhodanese-like domain-containing protein 2 n=1 Tax=Antedon mediterranea TaxID=105859 RepID=UPI003AF65BE2
MYSNEKGDAISSKPGVTVRQKKLARKKAFGLFEASKKLKSCLDGRQWVCCGQNFVVPKSMHTHVSNEHSAEINNQVELLLQNPDLLTRRLHVSNIGATQPSEIATAKYDNNHTFPWLPSEVDVNIKTASAEERGCQVLLFYNYCNLDNPEDICLWQKQLCQRLQLTGKIRVASEGINGTVGGRITATELYIDALILHPAFQNINKEDFKVSKGTGDDFTQGLSVKVCNEIVQMGISPSCLSHVDAGNHITPSEFHEELERSKGNDNNIFIDCRNYYESKVGKFEGAVTPDIRKFSYWPEYVDQNLSLFQDKKVIMYCTGGIRCERGSAYLKSKGVCKDVVQLKGGIHRYIEQYPNGYFKGKLFVFDDRYTISTNDSIVAECSYCSKPFDKYQPCSSKHCHQLVLSCDQCRVCGKTACCEMCQEKATRRQEGTKVVEECSCTKKRRRIPTD